MNIRQRPPRCPVLADHERRKTLVMVVAPLVGLPIPRLGVPLASTAASGTPWSGSLRSLAAEYLRR